MPLMSSPGAVLHGVQEPTYKSVPPVPADYRLGADAVEFCASVGLVLDDWQAAVLATSLGERTDGRWAAREVGLIVPRQNGKGAILEARELVALFLLDDRLILHSAHEFKTASEAFLRIKSIVDNHDALRSRVKAIRTGHGEEGIELKNGARLRFVARSRGSGRGFSGDLIILDEAYSLPEVALNALLPTMSARPNPQIWYTSSAPLPDSTVLRRLCARGRAGESERLFYCEWSAPKGMLRSDPQTWAHANPALGYRLTEETIRSEFEAMGADGFDLERLGIFSENDRETVLKAWDTLADDESKIVGGVVFAVDISPDRSRSSIAVAGRRDDGITHVELVESRDGATWLLARLRELCRKWGDLTVILDERAGAGALISELEREPEFTIIKMNALTIATAAARIYDACAANVQGLRHLNQPSLNEAVAGAITRPIGDSWTWDRRKPEVDITPLVSVTFAHWGVTEGMADFDIGAQVF